MKHKRNLPSVARRAAQERWQQWWDHLVPEGIVATLVIGHRHHAAEAGEHIVFSGLNDTKTTIATLRAIAAKLERNAQASEQDAGHKPQTNGEHGQ